MIKVGVIGIGGISRAHIAGYLAHPERCEIVAMADIVPGKAATKAAAAGLDAVRCYDSAQAMLEAEDLDLVSISTPPESHAELAVAALEHGVNVLVEKPMAPSLEECDAMIAAERASGKTLSVIAQNRFRDDVLVLKDVLDSGLIGPVSHVRVSSAWWRGLPYYDLWWRGTWDVEGGGCTLNHAIHHVDLLLWFLGRPESVVALLTNAQHENSEVEDLSVALLRYGRAIAELTSSVVHHGEQQEIVIHGREAMVAQPWSVVADVTAPNGFPAPGGNAELVARIEEVAAAREPLAHTLHPGQIGDVLAALADGRAPLVTSADGRAAVELVTAIYEAGIEGGNVELPLAADDPYRRDGHRAARAPRFYEKSASVAELDEDIVVGSSADR
ncbi:MAG: Gfo/Idh/MocA family oxidoreductase [Salana multivorans]|uniref:Gfo/Idh/MocA family protein n=1 Tax=Salana multivorans TaxID=120377 RepID=UPI00096A1EBE|nr:Gfo/Idh/MocA family oxidoreductase [Salana multivorans]MBN8881545.1 Gfo/Idh/MocA family oxidoreductase [Salana multivorans]OJX97703.1 MAG: oxidoreductase [Micrococcales bacterium 73-15]